MIKTYNQFINEIEVIKLNYNDTYIVDLLLSDKNIKNVILNFYDKELTDAFINFEGIDDQKLYHFYVLEALYIFNHDYNSIETQNINYIISKLMKEKQFKPSPLLQRYENLEETAQKFYNDLVQEFNF